MHPAGFVSEREFVSRHVQMGVCFQMYLSSVFIQMALDAFRQCFQMALGHVHSMTDIKWISDSILSIFTVILCTIILMKQYES